MTSPSISDSDAIRSAKPLAHAQYATFGPLALEKGGELPSVRVCYETYGTLTPQRDNAVLICHALSGDSHVARHHPGDDPGWWDTAPIIGPGRPIDTDRYFVICPNILGGCRGTTGPNSTNPATGRPYASTFPLITIRDMVEVQRRLVDHLRIPRLLAVVGGSMGGQQVLEWATGYPERLAGAVPIATAPRLTAQALAFDIVGRNAILSDPNFNGGDYYHAANGGDGGNGGCGGPGGPDIGLAIARMLAHITYLSPESMTAKFDPIRNQPRTLDTDFEVRFGVGSYLAHQGHRFVERFDANSYLALTRAMDLYDLGSTPGDLARVFAACTCRFLVMSFTSDWLFPPFQSQDMVNALLATNRPVTYANLTSSCGHDAFLLPQDVDRYGELLRHFLANLDGQAAPPAADAPDRHAPTSIFHGDRLDSDLIAELVPPDAAVLDLGCGHGNLLAALKARGHRRLMGVELDERALVACARRGLDVVHADLNLGLPSFADQQFDCVTLSQTLQAVRDVERIIADMLRVGRRCIVSFPNFAYGPIRQQLLTEGRAPTASALLPYAWYNSPNIRFLSIADFEDFCRVKGIRIHERLALDTTQNQRITTDPNLNADTAIFVLSR